MVISYGLLNNNLLQLLDFYSRSNKYQYECLQTLYNTGCRYIECYEKNRWVDLGNDFYSVQSAKGGNLRLINKAVLPVMFQRSLSDSQNLFDCFRKTNMEREIKKNIGIRNITIGDKGCSIHLFRYRYIRGLELSGMSRSEIAIDVGEVDITNINGYCDNDIYGF